MLVEALVLPHNPALIGEILLKFVPLAGGSPWCLGACASKPVKAVLWCVSLLLCCSSNNPVRSCPYSYEVTQEATRQSDEAGVGRARVDGRQEHSKARCHYSKETFDHMTCSAVPRNAEIIHLESFKKNANTGVIFALETFFFAGPKNSVCYSLQCFLVLHDLAWDLYMQTYLTLYTLLSFLFLSSLSSCALP